MLETGLAIGSPFYDTFSGPGGTRWLLTTKAPLGDGSGRATEVLTVALDVTELRAAEAATAAPSQEDLLTGLPSGEHFRTRCEHELARARREHEMLAVLHLDLDRFKGINDAFGKEFGTELLREVAVRLKARLHRQRAAGAARERRVPDPADRHQAPGRRGRADAGG